MVKERIIIALGRVVSTLALPASVEPQLQRPADLEHGDYTTNIALTLAKAVGQAPRALAEQIAAKLREKDLPAVEKITVASAGFINFYLAPDYWLGVVRRVLDQGENYGRNDQLAGQKVLVEFTDPNPFKEFHIGHLMSNAIGESIARLLEFSGAEIRRACYQGDVGLHVAKAIWGSAGRLAANVKELAWAYVRGAQAYETDPTAKTEIEIINKKIYRRADPSVNRLYDAGRKISLDYFETIYQRLGTKFDFYFFESEAGRFGQTVVVDGLTNGIFERSDGAVVYRGEIEGLHTRVFITTQGLPTYEAKELGLAKLKYDAFPYDFSLVITGNEVNDYFKVLLAVLHRIFPDLAAKTRHLGHGMLRLPTGKMSSRTGEVISAEQLLGEIAKRVGAKITDRALGAAERERIASVVAVVAAKYSILRQAIGGDVIFDFDQSVSLTGDSGPYLQYAYARASSVLKKAASARSDWPDHSVPLNGEPSFILERWLDRFPEVVARAAAEYAPHYLAAYLHQLATEFNHYYAHQQIIGSDTGATYRLDLTRAVAQVLRSGCHLLGFSILEKM